MKSHLLELFNTGLGYEGTLDDQCSFYAFFPRTISSRAFHILIVRLGRFERDKKYRGWEETVSIGTYEKS